MSERWSHIQKLIFAMLIACCLSSPQVEALNCGSAMKALKQIGDWLQKRSPSQLQRKLEQAKLELATEIRNSAKSTDYEAKPELVEAWRKYLGLALQLKTPVELMTFHPFTMKYSPFSLGIEGIELALKGLSLDSKEQFLIAGSVFGMRYPSIPPQFVSLPGVLKWGERERKAEVFEAYDRYRSLLDLLERDHEHTIFSSFDHHYNFLRITISESLNLEKFVFGPNIYRLYDLTHNLNLPELWEAIVKRVTYFVREEFLGRHDTYPDLRQVLSIFSKVDRRLSPDRLLEEEVEEEILGPAEDVASLHRSETVDLDPNEVPRLEQNKSLDEIQGKIEKFNPILPSKGIQQKMRNLEHFLKIFGQSGSRINSFDLELLRERDLAAYKALKEKTLGLFEDSHKITRSYSYRAPPAAFNEFEITLRSFEQHLKDDWIKVPKP